MKVGKGELQPSHGQAESRRAAHPAEPPDDYGIAAVSLLVLALITPTFAGSWTMSLLMIAPQSDQAQQLPRMPPDPEMTHERLKPYLRGWSPSGPDRW